MRFLKDNLGSVRKQKGLPKTNLGMRRPLGIRLTKKFDLKRTPSDLELSEATVEPALQYHKRNLFLALSNAYHLLIKRKEVAGNFPLSSASSLFAIELSVSFCDNRKN